MLKSKIRTFNASILTVICLSIVAFPNVQNGGAMAKGDRSSAISYGRLRHVAHRNRGLNVAKLGVNAAFPRPDNACPPPEFDANASNLLRNSSFEEAGPRGRSASFPGRDGAEDDARSAAAHWTMHTANPATVTTRLVKSQRLGTGALMLHISAGSNEGGVYQLFARDDHGPRRVVASVWVFVRRGRVVLATGNEGITPYSSFSTTTGQWEQLRLCSDGTTTNNWFVVYSTAVEGSDFYVDMARVSKVEPASNRCSDVLIENIVPPVTFPGGEIAINGRNFGHRQGTKIAAINRRRVDRLQVTRWTDTQILARSPLDLVGGTYRVLIYCDDTYRTSSNSLEVVVRDDLHRPR